MSEKLKPLGLGKEVMYKCRTCGFVLKSVWVLRFCPHCGKQPLEIYDPLNIKPENPLDPKEPFIPDRARYFEDVYTPFPKKECRIMDCVWVPDALILKQGYILKSELQELLDTHWDNIGFDISVDLKKLIKELDGKEAEKQ